ncbi:MAG: precorrin-6y C5,15-methyltransferase (decarboxylating) subunit CbiE, partial [Mycobacterium sp.]
MPIPDLHLVVVGIGADGWDGLTAATRAVILSADVVLGGARQLALLPLADGQARQPWPSPLRRALPDVLQQFAGRRVVALASGDPMLSGIGTTLVETLGAERVTVIPHVSSTALARSRLGWSAESTAVVRVVGRDVYAVLRELAPAHRVLVLSSDEKTPAAIAALLAARGYGPSRFVIL